MKKAENIKKNFSDLADKSDQNGFSLVEVVVALVIFLIVLLGLAAVFTYAVNYNAGNNSRSQALAVLQQEVELYRSAKFTPQLPIDPDLSGGTKTPKTVTAADGNKFLVQRAVDDNPSTTDVDVNDASTLKEITVTVTLVNPTAGWQTAVPAKAVLRRARAN